MAIVHGGYYLQSPPVGLPIVGSGDMTVSNRPEATFLFKIIMLLYCLGHLPGTFKAGGKNNQIARAE